MKFIVCALFLIICMVNLNEGAAALPNLCPSGIRGIGGTGVKNSGSIGGGGDCSGGGGGGGGGGSGGGSGGGGTGGGGTGGGGNTGGRTQPTTVVSCSNSGGRIVCSNGGLSGLVQLLGAKCCKNSKLFLLFYYFITKNITKLL